MNENSRNTSGCVFLLLSLGVLVEVNKFLDDLPMLEILMVDDIGLTQNGKVFDRDGFQLILATLFILDAFGNDRDTEVVLDEILDGRNGVDFQDDVEVIQREVLCLQIGCKQVPGAGRRQTQNQFLLPQFV